MTAIVAGLGWLLSYKGTAAPSVPSRWYEGQLYALVDTPGAVIKLSVRVGPDSVEITREPSGGDSDAGVVGVALVGDLRLQLSSEDVSLAREEGIRVMNFPADRGCSTRKEGDRDLGLPPEACDAYQVIMFPPPPRKVVDDAPPSVAGTPAGRWSDEAAGQRVVRTPMASFSDGLGLPRGRRAWPPSNERWRRPDIRSGLSVKASASPDEELLASSPEFRRQAFRGGTEWALPVTISKPADRPGVALEPGYARYVRPGGAARAQQMVIVGGILLGLATALIVELGLLYIRR